MNSLPSRPLTGTLALLLILFILGVDYWQATPINPYQAPLPAALGSGQPPSAAHCTAL